MIPVSVGLVALAVTIAGIIYKSGRDRERFANNEKQAKAWADGIGGIVRTNSTRQERRWMLQLADDVENAETEGKRKQIATRIREEIWRS